ncbi:MAG: hypothetical protein PHR06_08525 [Candidatus Cloacimonetes bacterium]|nr:hypothetical protein [Candidatus Cloacimonadota bacterium]
MNEKDTEFLEIAGKVNELVKKQNAISAEINSLEVVVSCQLSNSH